MVGYLIDLYFLQADEAFRKIAPIKPAIPKKPTHLKNSVKSKRSDSGDESKRSDSGDGSQVTVFRSILIFILTPMQNYLVIL